MSTLPKLANQGLEWSAEQRRCSVPTALRLATPIRSSDSQLVNTAAQRLIDSRVLEVAQIQNKGDPLATVLLNCVEGGMMTSFFCIHTRV